MHVPRGQGRTTLNPDAPDPLFDHATISLKLPDDGHRRTSNKPENPKAAISGEAFSALPPRLTDEVSTNRLLGKLLRASFASGEGYDEAGLGYYCDLDDCIV